MSTRPEPKKGGRRILWLSWKDRDHPAAGGAEEVMIQLLQRLAADGHEVTLLTAAYKDAAPDETVEGVHIIRRGSNRYIHSFQALWYYRRHLYDQFDIVVEVVNTAPYFAARMPGRAKPVLLYHQLAREVWFYETGWPLNRIGYHILEPGATKLLSRAKATVLSMSDSTKKDLVRHGFDGDDIRLLTEGIHIKPAKSWNAVPKYKQPTVLSLGAIRGMKRTLDQIRAFEHAKPSIPDLQLKIAGGSYGSYGKRVLDYIALSPYKKDIQYLGKVSDEQKRRLMGRSHLILVSSVKEGWGLIVSEANSQGTPAVVYDADGLRDSVRHGVTGLVCQPDPAAMAAGISELLTNQASYQAMRRAAYKFARTLTFDRTYTDFKRAVL